MGKQNEMYFNGTFVEGATNVLCQDHWVPVKCRNSVWAALSSTSAEST